MESEGKFRTFASGAVRDTAKKKPMIHLISPFFLQDLGEWLRFACQDRKPEPYPPRNWEQGMPFSETLGSGLRHVTAIMEGDESEDHIAAIGFMAMALSHYRHEIAADRMDPALDDMPHYAPRPGDRRINPETGQDEVYVRIPAGTAVSHAVRDFCTACGATIPHRSGEGTCAYCSSNVIDSETSDIDEDMYQRLVDMWGITKTDRILDSTNKTFYVCGPMRGLPFFNFPAFDGARDLGKSLGYNIISPADLDRKTGFDPLENPDQQWDMNPAAKRKVFKRDFKVILFRLKAENKDGLALLPGWRNSWGGLAEVTLARVLGLQFKDARTFDDLLIDNEGWPEEI